ncbi:MAG: hypothetical protein AB1420_11385 [Bacillota bacterium]
MNKLEKKLTPWPNLIIIDEAHILTPQTLNELWLLTNTKVKNEPLITLMLFG